MVITVILIKFILIPIIFIVVIILPIISLETLINFIVPFPIILIITILHYFKLRCRFNKFIVIQEIKEELTLIINH